MCTSKDTDKKCCHGGEKEVEEKQSYGSCCHGGEKEVEEKQSYGSCCHGGEKEAEEKQSYGSCCHGEEKEVEEKQSYGSCCHGGESGGIISRIKKFKYLEWIILGVSLVSLIVSFLSPFHNHAVLKFFDIGWIAVILCGFPIINNAIKTLKKKKLTSGVLISVSILACIALEILILTNFIKTDSHSHGYIFAAGEVAWLMAIGEKIERITVKKARSGIQSLISISPQTAKYMTESGIVEKPISEVKIGDEVVVLPNDMISVDGVIVKGSSAVDESVMTGESVPVDKSEGDKIFGGTWNKTGALTVKVLKTSDEMAVAKLKKLVEEAAGKKAPISKTADKWAGYIVPSAIILAVVVFVLNFFLIQKGNLAYAILGGVTMLVVFCPCALALATPTAIAAGLGASSRQGILIKSGGAIEELARVKIVAFDKTGTLTRGRIEVDGIFAYNTTKERLMRFAGATERMSEHPIAKAIVLYCQNHVKIPNALDTKSLVGTGVSASVEGEKITVCRWDNLDDLGVDYSIAKPDADRLLFEGKTLVAVVGDGGLYGIISLFDTLNEGANDAVLELEKIGIDSVMLTGDNVFAANAIGERVGIKTVHASLLPDQKLAKIESYRKQNQKVCMVGDGVNDAPSLAAANCSIAMGALGSDIAIETADISLLNSDIKNVSRLAKFSKRVLTTIKINIILSMTLNVLAIVLNLAGFLNPVTGALMHNASSVTVVLNSALLLIRFPKQ